MFSVLNSEHQHKMVFEEVGKVVRCVWKGRWKRRERPTWGYRAGAAWLRGEGRLLSGQSFQLYCRRFEPLHELSELLNFAHVEILQSCLKHYTRRKL